MNIPIILISYLALVVFGLSDNIRGPLFSEILKEFTVNDSYGSLFFSISSIMGFVTSLSSLYFFKIFHKYTLLIIASLGLSLTLIGFYFSTSFSFILFLSGLFGVFAGLLGLLPNVLVPSAVGIDKRQQVLSGLHSMYGIASLLAPLFVTQAMGITHSWRSCFLIGSLFSLSLFVYLLFLPKNKFDISQEKTKKINETNHPYFLNFIFGLILSMAVMTEVMISSRLPLLLQRVWRVEFSRASLSLSYFFLALLCGRLFFTFKSFKVSLVKQISILLISSMVLIFLGVNGHPYSLILAGLTIAPIYPLTAALIAEIFVNRLDRAMSIAVSFNSIMLALMHLIIGKVTDLYGISNAFKLGILFLFISLLLLNFYKNLLKIFPIKRLKS
jgi:MFS family permease